MRHFLNRNSAIEDFFLIKHWQHYWCVVDNRNFGNMENIHACVQENQEEERELTEEELWWVELFRFLIYSDILCRLELFSFSVFLFIILSLAAIRSMCNSKWQFMMLICSIIDSPHLDFPTNRQTLQVFSLAYTNNIGLFACIFIETVFKMY